MWELFLIFGIVAVLAMLYLICVALGAKHTTDQAPRAEMFTCDKHGLFPSKYTMKLSGVTEQPILQCPFCFEDRIKEARARAK